MLQIVLEKYLADKSVKVSRRAGHLLSDVDVPITQQRLDINAYFNRRNVRQKKVRHSVHYIVVTNWMFTRIEVCAMILVSMAPLTLKVARLALKRFTNSQPYRVARAFSQ